MLSESVKIVDVDPLHWLNLHHLVRAGAPGRGPHPEEGEARGGPVRLIVEKGQILKAFQTGKDVKIERLPENIGDPAEVAEKMNAPEAGIIERGAIRRTMHRIQSSLSLDMNFAEQLLTVYQAVREQMGEGIKVHPRPRMPEFKYSALTTILKTVLPAGELLVAVIYSEDGSTRDTSGLPIVTSLIARMNPKAEIDLLTTTDSLVPSGLLVSDWKTDYSRVNDLARRVLDSKVFLGLHLPSGALKTLARQAGKDGPKALSALNKSGEIVIDPFPLRFKALLKMGGMVKL